MNKAQTIDQIQIINNFIISGQQEFLLSHGARSKQADRGNSARDNVPSFARDLEQGLLEHYTETFVVYHKGTLCGQSTNGKNLYDQATIYYGYSDLAVFQVPKSSRKLPIAGALGQY